jgi:O-antigen/teichoic acid export membrane protein
MEAMLSKIRLKIKDLLSSSVFWSWLMNGLRMTSGLIVLPLLIHYLPKPEFDMYFVFLSFWALIPIIDFGFVHNFGRAIAYAMAGASRLLTEGYEPEPNAKGPNYQLLFTILNTTRFLYRWFAIGTLAIFATIGTWIIFKGVKETTSPTITWIAWGLMIIAIALEIYLAWWNNALMNMNRVRLALQYTVLAMMVRLIILTGLLIGGASLLSLPISNIISSLVQRVLSRIAVLKELPKPIPPPNQEAIKSTILQLWPNTWRTGIHLFSGYLSTQAMTLVCLKTMGLATSGMYGFTNQLLNIASSIAQAWTQVKWPYINQLRIKGDLSTLEKILRVRVWLQFTTYILIALIIVFLIPHLLSKHHSGKTLLPSPWLELMAGLKFFELSLTLSTTLIFTENRMPFFWATTFTNLASVILAVVLVKLTSLDLGAVILPPLILGLAYNFWKWPIEALRGINTTPLKFLFSIKPRDLIGVKESYTRQ